jgi:hypothetical protein
LRLGIHNNMTKVPLWLPLSLALLALIFSTIWTTKLRFVLFAPFCAICYYKYPFSTCLWLSMLAGLIVDVLSSQLRFGLHGLSYVAATFFCYRHKKHFFEDKFHSIPLLSSLIALIYMTALAACSFLFDRQIKMSPAMLFTDFIAATAFDLLYAFLWFSLPIYLFTLVKNGKLKLLLFQPKEGSDE